MYIKYKQSLMSSLILSAYRRKEMVIHERRWSLGLSSVWVVSAVRFRKWCHWIHFARSTCHSVSHSTLHIYIASRWFNFVGCWWLVEMFCNLITDWILIKQTPPEMAPLMNQHFLCNKYIMLQLIYWVIIETKINLLCSKTNFLVVDIIYIHLLGPIFW